MFDAAVVENRRWSVAMTVPRGERIAKQQAEEIGIDAFLPLKEMPPTPGCPINVRPLWGGYLFLRTARLPEIEPDIPAIRAVRNLIATADGRTIFAPAGMVEALIDRADKDGIIEKFVEPQMYRPKIGDQVRLLYGALAGQFAMVVKVSGAALQLEFSCAISKFSVFAKSEQVAPIA